MKKSFEDIAKGLPILKETERMCQLIAGDMEFRRQQLWYEVIKPLVTKNVGNLSPYPDLKNSDDYDTVYHHLAEILDF